MPFDDIVKFKKMGKDLADKVEEKRQKMMEYRKQTRMGTLPGFEDMIAKRKKEMENAKRNSY